MGFLNKVWNAVVCWFCWTGLIAMLLVAVDAAINDRLYTFWDGVMYIFMLLLFSVFTVATISESVKEDGF